MWVAGAAVPRVAAAAAAVLPRGAERRMRQGGCRYPGVDDEAKLVAFETALMRLQMQMEESFCAVAACNGRWVARGRRGRRGRCC